MDQLELDLRFTYHAPSPNQVVKYDAIRNMARGLAVHILTLTPESREQSLAITHLEQAVMWANAAIARRD